MYRSTHQRERLRQNQFFGRRRIELHRFDRSPTRQTYYYVTTSVDNSGDESTYSEEVQMIIP